MRGDFYFLHQSLGPLVDSGMSLDKINESWQRRGRRGPFSPVRNSQDHQIVTIVQEGSPVHAPAAPGAIPHYTSAILRVSNRNIQTVLSSWLTSDFDSYVKVSAPVFGFGNTGDIMCLHERFFCPRENNSSGEWHTRHKSIGGIDFAAYPLICDLLRDEKLTAVCTSEYSPGINYAEIPQLDDVMYIIPYAFRGVDAHIITDTVTVSGATVVKRVLPTWYEYMPPSLKCPVSKINTAGVITVKGRPDILIMPIFLDISVELSAACTSRYFIDYLDSVIENANYAGKIYEEQARKLWVDMLGRLDGSNSAELEDSRAEVTTRIGRLSADLTDALITLRDIDTRIAVASAPEAGTQSEQINKLIQWGCTVDPSGQVSSAIDNIILPHGGKLYKIGCLNVIVKADPNITRPVVVQVKAGTRKYAIGHEHPHPHADPAGIVCLGAVADFVGRALKTGSVAGAIAAVNAIMRQYNASSPHRRIEGAWPECDAQGQLLHHNEADFPVVGG